MMSPGEQCVTETRRKKTCGIDLGKIRKMESGEKAVEVGTSGVAFLK
jgi:hypothetical protein